MPEHALKTALQAHAATLGFAQLGCTDMSPFVDWERQVAAQSQDDRDALRGKAFASRPAEEFPWARSLVVAMYPFSPGSSAQGDAERLLGGYSAYYRWSHVAYQQVALLANWLRWQGYRVETHALLPLKAAGHRAGLAYYGRNGLLHHTTFGSLISLQPLLTDAVIPSDAPLPEMSDCGNCRICVDACPTGALSAEGAVQPHRCLRYWQDREDIPPDIRRHMGLRIQGCDTCQTCCPRNAAVLSKAVAAPNPYFIPALLNETGHERVRRMAEIGALVGDNLARPGRLSAMAAIAAGNAGALEMIPLLVAALQHQHPHTRRMAAWALGRLNALERPEERLTQDQLTEYTAGRNDIGALEG